MEASRRNQNRRGNGSLIAEAPVALWLLLFFFTVPFFDMATILIRYTFFVAAARDGVHEAARSKTFQFDASATSPSAINKAVSTVNTTASSFNEIRVNSTITRILETNITNQRMNIYTTKLAAPADTTANLYEIETYVTGTIRPLVPSSPGFLLGIPGLTSPVPVVVSAREYCEYPQGLNQ